MKVQVTQKQVRTNYKAYMVTDGNPLECILSHVSAGYYNSGVYGWNADIYTFDNVAFVRGYRPFGNVFPSDVMKKFARRIKFVTEAARDGYSRQLAEKELKLLRDVATELSKPEY